ncbi:MAG: radical SAM protein, partial [Ignavibacteriaceae bacterium]
MNLRSFPAARQNIKRLKGISLINKINYLIKTIFGEILRRRTKGAFGLRLVEIALTDRCQCRCEHCFAHHKDHLELMKEELTTQEVKSLIDEIDSIGGVEIIFTGGEPLL